MDTKHLPINHGAKDKEVEDLTASFPHGCIAVLLLAFFIEPVDLCDLTRFMVPADQSHPIRIS